MRKGASLDDVIFSTPPAVLVHTFHCAQGELLTLLRSPRGPPWDSGEEQVQEHVLTNSNYTLWLQGSNVRT